MTTGDTLQLQLWDARKREYQPVCLAVDTAKFIGRTLVPLGFTASEAFKVAVALTERKSELQQLLDYPDAEQNEAQS